MDHDPFEELRRDPALVNLARRLDAERRAEAEEDERLAALDRLRARRLRDLVLEACHRGDEVEVAFPGRRVRGVPVHVADDLATLRGPAGLVDVRLGAVCAWRVVQRAASGGAVPGGGAKTFTARLAEHEAAGGCVTVGVGLLGLELVGRLSVAARDHVVLRGADGQDWHLPHAHVDWVASPA